MRQRTSPFETLAGAALAAATVGAGSADASPIPPGADRKSVEASQILLEREYDGHRKELRLFLDSIPGSAVFNAIIAPAMDALIDAESDDPEWRIRLLEHAIESFALNEIGRGYGGVDALIVKFSELEQAVKHDTPNFSPRHRIAVKKALEGYRSLALRRYIGTRRVPKER